MNYLKVRLDPRSLLLEVLPRGSTGAEIGVAKGDYSKRLLRAVKPKRLILIDPWAVAVEGPHRRAAHYGADKVNQESLDKRYKYVCDRFHREREEGRVSVCRGTFQGWSESIESEDLDWVYIDGDHSHKGVLRDLYTAIRSVKKGGLIACDDYGVEGWWESGVTSAVHEFMANEDVVAEFVVGSQFVLRKLSGV